MENTDVPATDIMYRNIIVFHGMDKYLDPDVSWYIYSGVSI